MEKGFFKFFSPENSAKRLKIPSAFTDYKNGKLPRKVSLRDRFGNMWPIGVAKTGRNYYFQYGWEKFIEDNTVEFGDFLIFDYNGTGVFDMKLLGRTGCEKKGAGGLKCAVKEEEEEEMNVEHQKSVEPKWKNWSSDSSSSSSDDSDEDYMVEEEEEDEDEEYEVVEEEIEEEKYEREIIMCEKKEPRSKNRRVEEEEDDDYDEQEYEEDMEDTEEEEEKEEQTEKVPRSKRRHVEEQEDDEEEEEEGEEETEKAPHSKRRYVEEENDDDDEVEEYEEEEEEEEEEKNERAESFKKKAPRSKAGCKTTTARKVRDRHDQFGADIFKSGRATQPKNPYFVAKIRAKRRDQLYIPIDVVRDYKLELPASMTICDSAGREFETKLKIWKDGRIWLHGGWRSLCRWNLVEKNDRCICEFVKGKGKKGLFLQVQILHLLQN